MTVSSTLCAVSMLDPLFAIQALSGRKWFVIDYLLDRAMKEYDKSMDLSEVQKSELKNKVIFAAQSRAGPSCSALEAFSTGFRMTHPMVETDLQGSLDHHTTASLPPPKSI